MDEDAERQCGGYRHTSPVMDKHIKEFVVVKYMERTRTYPFPSYKLILELNGRLGILTS